MYKCNRAKTQRQENSQGNSVKWMVRCILLNGLLSMRACCSVKRGGCTAGFIEVQSQDYALFPLRFSRGSRWGGQLSSFLGKWYGVIASLGPPAWLSYWCFFLASIIIALSTCFTFSFVCFRLSFFIISIFYIHFSLTNIYHCYYLLSLSLSSLFLQDTGNSLQTAEGVMTALKDNSC